MVSFGSNQPNERQSITSKLNMLLCHLEAKMRISKKCKINFV